MTICPLTPHSPSWTVIGALMTQNETMGDGVVGGQIVGEIRKKKKMGTVRTPRRETTRLELVTSILR